MLEALIIGLLILLIAVFLSVFPPRRLNTWYGYRMPSSLEDQASWDVANQYVRRQFYYTGVILIVLGIIGNAIWSSSGDILPTLAVVPLLMLSVFKTERYMYLRKRSEIKKKLSLDGRR